VPGCPECGYPLRLTDTECPQCGYAFTGRKGQEDSPKIEQPITKKPSVGGTVILGPENSDEGRKKLVGFLVTYSHLSNGEFFPLYEGRNFIGQSSSSNVCIKGDLSVSEKHLSILFRTVDRKFKFKDEQSSNGTFINEELIDEGELKNFDIIRIGTTQLIFMAIPQNTI